MSESLLATFQALWAILWRSIVFVPWMLLAFMFLLGMLVGLTVLPVFTVIYGYAACWPEAGISLALWLPVLWAWRHYRWWKHFEGPPSVL